MDTLAKGIIATGPKFAGKVNEIVSIGTHCLAAALLKKYRLKSNSYPFDWIFSGTDVLIHCLEDDFKDYCDQKYHESIDYIRNGRLEQGSNHALFQKKYGAGDFFTHRDVTRPENLAYFERCVERFRALRGRDDVLFLMIDIKPLEPRFDEISNALESYFGPCKLLCIEVQHEPDAKSKSLLRHIRTKGDHHLYGMAPFSRSTGVSFPCIADEYDVLKILSIFDISVSVDKALPHWKRLIQRLGVRPKRPRLLNHA